MNRLLRGPLRRLDVQIALGTMLVVLLVGVAVAYQMADALERHEERRYREEVARATEQVLDQIAIYQDLMLLATVWIASLDEVRAALAAGEADRATAAIRASFEPLGFGDDSPPTLHLFSPDGGLLAGTYPLSGETGETPGEILAVLQNQRPLRSARVTDHLGPSISAAAPVMGSDDQLIAVLEGITAVDDEFVRGYAELLGVHVAASHDHTLATSAAGVFEPRATGGSDAGSIAYADLDGTRYLTGVATLRALDGSPVVHIFVGVAEEEVLAGIAGARATVTPVIGAGALLAVALSFGVARLTSRHMRELSAAARRIQENDLEHPVTVGGAGEIRDLAIAMEGMRGALKESRDTLLATNQDLALRVDTSTTNLVEVTHELAVMHRVLAQLDGEGPGGLPRVAQALTDLEWVDGALLAVVQEHGQLVPVAVAGISPSAAAALADLVNRTNGMSRGESLYVAQSSRDVHFATLSSRGIGGFAAEVMLTPDGIAGFVAVTTADHLTLTAQREELLRSVAREVALTLERTELADEVEENRRLAESVLREMSDGVLVLDHQQICRIANPAAVRLLGRSRTAVIGHPATEYLPITANTLERQRQRHGTDGTAPLVTEVGGRQVAVVATPFPEPDPDRTGLILMLRDLSAQAEAERVKQDFVSMVGHELRTPLTLIRTTIDLLHEGDAGELNETQQRIVGVLRNNSERLMSLISDLLDMSALDAGRMHIAPDWIDLGDAIQSATESQRNHAATKQHTLHVEVPAGITVWADRTRIEQVVSNLVSNAIKYTPPGGTVAVAVRDAGEVVEITVSDDGIGIAPQEQDQLFEKFYRTSAGQRTTGGAGLGLAITRALVELHGGTVRVESDGQTGSTFIVTLPRSRV